MNQQLTHLGTKATPPNRSLGILSLGTLLVCAHYGLGFILGTAEQSIAIGVAGSLYAVSLGIGFLMLLFLVKFYWQSVDQIWTLLGNRYGQPVKLGIALMSWISLIGIEAVQMIAATTVLGIVGFPEMPTMIGLTVLFCILSLLPVERASQIFRGLLLFNIATLLYALWRLDSLSELLSAPVQFLPDLYQADWYHQLGIFISTILMVMIDMKCQQFIVQAKTVRVAYWSCILAGITLCLLAFLPTAVVMAGQHRGILPERLSSKEILPYILSWLGGGSDRWQGVLWILALAIPALGIGSNILRIQTKTILDLNIISPNLRHRQVWVAVINALLALSVALRGGEIVNLILNFYAAYLSSVWIPFIAYLLAHGKRYVFSQRSVRFSLLTGAIASVATLGITLLHPEAIFFHSSELTIIAVGMGISCTTLFFTQALETYRTMYSSQEEM
jgi:SSS family solute:Na+ symporter